ncbi:MAG: hypothetical protein NTX71_02780 [Candidatus Aureabacteria bacterium]|nr:hypothetical protein [Candidatus Auribacterota bacterium]
MDNAGDHRFTRDRAGWIIVILNLLMAANSTFYFTRVLGAGWDGWLAMNSCAPSIFIFAIGYLLRQKSVMAVGAGLMFRYGTLGLFAFGWEGMNIIPQVGHILMTLGVIYFIARMIRLDCGGEIIVAALTALVLLYAEWQGEWFRNCPQILDHLMKGTLQPEIFKPQA